MTFPTYLSVLGALLFLNLADFCGGTDPDSLPTLTTVERQLNDELRATLRFDELTQDDRLVKIEFEYHDLFIDERIPSPTLMVKYQELLHAYGVTPGPQRQVHLLQDGGLLIGDFDDRGQLIGTPIRLLPVGHAQYDKAVREMK